MLGLGWTDIECQQYLDYEHRYVNTQSHQKREFNKMEKRVYR